nr:hypothetical protein [Lachnospiraceae bacterium]
MTVVAICDKETRFVQIFAEYLRKKYRSDIEIEAFDKVDRLLDIPSERNLGLCLVGEGMLQSYELEELLKKTEHVFYFSGKRKKDHIFKFQSVEQVTKDLLALCSDKGIVFPEDSAFYKRRRDMKIISFYSPVHPVHQSCLALTMGQLMAAEKKVLYLNFEPYSGFEYMMQKKYKRDLMDIFFFLKEEKGKFRLRLESIMENVGGLDYIPPVFCHPDMEEIDMTLWHKLIRRIVEETDYEVLLLDLTEQTRGVFSLLEMCDDIYTCLSEDGLAKAKADQYERLLHHMKKEKLLERTTKCIVPVFHNIPVAASMYTHSELADFVKQLMEEGKKIDPV